MSNGTRSYFWVSFLLVFRGQKRSEEICYFINRWLQIKWNKVVAPLVREYSLIKSTPSKSKESKSIASTLRDNNIESGVPYEAVACRALYVLLQRAVSRDCPLTGEGKIIFHLNIIQRIHSFVII